MNKVVRIYLFMSLMLCISYSLHHTMTFNKYIVSNSPKKSSKTKSAMFSGIIEEIGTIERLDKKELQLWDGSSAEGVELMVKTMICKQDAYIGCSISVNGACLTATSIHDNLITFGIAPETLRRTNLGYLTIGSKVNLERAMQANGRNSGHFVQGHVDCVGRILEKWNENDSLWVKVAVPSEYMKYIVPKGEN